MQEIMPFALLKLQLGERGSGIKGRSQTVQDFVQLRDSCLQNGELFEDPLFPADDSSLYYSRRAGRNFQWMRPTVRSFSFSYM